MSNFTIYIYDASGKLLQSQSHTATGTLQKIQVNMTGFASGIYQLHLKMGKETAVYKVVKE